MNATCVQLKAGDKKAAGFEMSCQILDDGRFGSFVYKKHDIPSHDNRVKASLSLIPIYNWRDKGCQIC